MMDLRVEKNGGIILLLELNVSNSEYNIVQVNLFYTVLQQPERLENTSFHLLSLMSNLKNSSTEEDLQQLCIDLC